jgi:hypothetical protein
MTQRRKELRAPIKAVSLHESRRSSRYAGKLPWENPVLMAKGTISLGHSSALLRLMLLSCRFTHDIPTYLSTKDRDIFFPSPSSAISTPPFIASHSDFVPPLLTPSVNANTTCAAFLEYGQCKHGFKCRFLGAHIQKSDDGQSQLHTDGLRLVSAEPDVVGKKIAENTERNFVDHGLMKALRTKKVGTRST